MKWQSDQYHVNTMKRRQQIPFELWTVYSPPQLQGHSNYVQGKWPVPCYIRLDGADIWSWVELDLRSMNSSHSVKTSHSSSYNHSSQYHLEKFLECESDIFTTFQDNCELYSGIKVNCTHLFSVNWRKSGSLMLTSEQLYWSLSVPCLGAIPEQLCRAKVLV